MGAAEAGGSESTMVIRSLTATLAEPGRGVIATTRISWLWAVAGAGDTAPGWDFGAVAGPPRPTVPPGAGNLTIGAAPPAAVALVMPGGIVAALAAPAINKVTSAEMAGTVAIGRARPTGRGERRRDESGAGVAVVESTHLVVRGIDVSLRWQGRGDLSNCNWCRLWYLTALRALYAPMPITC